METAEIIEGLRSILSDFRNDQFTDGEFRALNAAIAALDPVPVTEAGLREMGFVEFAAYFSLSVTPTIDVVYWRSTGTFEIRTACLSCITINITSMQRLREVIAAIEGDADAG